MFLKSLCYWVLILWDRFWLVLLYYENFEFRRRINEENSLKKQIEIVTRCEKTIMLFLPEFHGSDVSLCFQAVMNECKIRVFHLISSEYLISFMYGKNNIYNYLDSIALFRASHPQFCPIYKITVKLKK